MSMKWPKREAGFWEGIPFFRLTLPLIVGILLYDAFSQKPFLQLPILAVAASLLLVVLFVLHHFRGRYPILHFLNVSLFLALSGYGLSAANDVRNRADFIGNIAPRQGTLLLQVIGAPKTTAKTWKMEAKTLFLLDTSGKAKPASGKILLTVLQDDSSCPFRIGDTLLAPAEKLQPHSGPTNPFGFDARRVYGLQNNYYELFLPTEKVFLCGRQPLSERSLTLRMNSWAMDVFQQNVADTDTHALLQAMLLGNADSFDPDLKRTYADTGVIHIVAISGSHLATLFLLFFFIPHLVRGPWGRRLQYTLGVSAVWLYVLLAGAPPSAIRAAVVFTLIGVSVLLNMRHNPLNTLLAGVFFILCFQPLWVFAIGFQLSVLSVLSIVLFYRHVRRWIPVKNWILKVLWEAVALSFCAQILVAPLSVYYFHNFPLAFLLANVVAWILLGLVAMYGGIGILIFYPWPAVSKGIAEVIAGVVRIFNQFIRFLQELNPTSLGHLQLSFPELLILYLLLGATAALLIHRNRKAFFIAGTSLAALLGFSVFHQFHTLQQERLVVYGNSNALLADHFHGRYFQPLFKDSNWKVLETTRTGYRAWRKNSQALNSNPIKIIAGKTVLIYADSANHFESPLDFPVDVLLLSRPLKGLSAAHLQSTFRPKIIVAGGDQKRRWVQSWQDSCKALRQPFHATPIDGAYVLE